MDVEVDPRARVLGSLSTAYWQLTEIAKALAQDAQVLIMDEPTASLARHETEALFAVGRTAEGTRNLDRLHLSPDGRGLPDRRPHHHPARRTADCSPSGSRDVTPAQIVEGIVGKELDDEMDYRERGHGRSRRLLLEAENLKPHRA